MFWKPHLQQSLQRRQMLLWNARRCWILPRRQRSHLAPDQTTTLFTTDHRIRPFHKKFWHLNNPKINLPLTWAMFTSCIRLATRDRWQVWQVNCQLSNWFLKVACLPLLVFSKFCERVFGKMAGVLFEDIFNVKDIDPEGKKFDRGKCEVLAQNAG